MNSAAFLAHPNIVTRITLCMDLMNGSSLNNLRISFFSVVSGYTKDFLYLYELVPLQKAKL